MSEYKQQILDLYLQDQETIGFSKQPIRTRYLGHVTGYQPIREQYFLVVVYPLFNLGREHGVINTVNNIVKSLEIGGVVGV